MVEELNERWIQMEFQRKATICNDRECMIIHPTLSPAFRFANNPPTMPSAHQRNSREGIAHISLCEEIHLQMRTGNRASESG